jgi:serine protease Do
VGSWLATPGFKDSKASPYPVATGVVSVAPRKIPAPPAAMGVSLNEREDIALVEAVLPGSPADEAGIQAGDVIRKVNDKEVKGRVDLVTTIRGFQPNDKVTLVIERDDKEVAMEVVLGNLAVIARPPEGIDRSDFQNHLGGELSERRSGFPTALQHDTVLKPSECGGPIVDLSGKVVGINIARAGRVESFALPAALIKSVLPDLMSGKLNPNPQTEAVADGTKPVAEEEKKVQ